jgi:hypothetical protein
MNRASTLALLAVAQAPVLEPTGWAGGATPGVLAAIAAGTWRALTS